MRTAVQPKFGFSTIALLSLICLFSTGIAAADVVTQWNEQVFTSGGPYIQRTLAMVHIAMFDAANAIEGGYSPYLTLPTPPEGASSEAAAASAAHGVLVRLFPIQQPALATTLNASLAGVPDGPAEDDGVAFGDLVAQVMYDARLADNILVEGPLYVPGTAPGEYQFTTPGPPQPVNRNAPNWLPFALKSVSQFRPNGPASLTGTQYARDLVETQLRGGSLGGRTPDEDQIARWHTEQAQFQFNRIARAEVQSDGRSMLEHARLFALLNMALADAVAAVFDAKYHYRFWRPVTAIRNADLDGNPDTHADLTWMPFLATPPHPEYPAAHGVVQGAPARVMTDYFGHHYAFTTTSAFYGPAVTRTYSSFDAYAEEGSFARILGGMHFRTSIEEGQRQGKQVGNWVLAHFFKPTQ